MAHKNEISNLIIDYENHILLTSSFDSQIIVWQELIPDKKSFKELQFKKIRKMKNAHSNGSISLTEVSVYHNLIITAVANSQNILIWNFEVFFFHFFQFLIKFGKLMASVTLPSEQEPTVIHIVSPYNLLLIGDNCGIITFLKMEPSEETMKFTLLSLIKFNVTFTKLITNNTSLLASTITGQLNLFDISKLFIDLQQFPHSSKRPNYNPHRQNKEDFLTIFQTHKINHWFINGSTIQIDKYESMQSSSPFQRKKSKLASPMSNPNFISISSKPQISIKAHKDALSTLQFIYLEGENLLANGSHKIKVISASLDQFIKIWEFPSLNLLASLNINHPLPILWNINIDQKEILKFKLAFSLKIIHFIRKNSAQQMNVAQARIFDPVNIFKAILKQISDNQQTFITANQVETRTRRSTKTSQRASQQQAEDQVQPKLCQKQVQLLKQEYEPRDLTFDSIKHIYKQELQGPNLKQLEEQKKIYNYGQSWRKEYEEQERMLEQLNKKSQHVHDEKQKDLKQVMQFLNPKYRKRILMDEATQIQNQNENAHTSGLVSVLDRKMERITSVNNSEGGSSMRKIVFQDEEDDLVQQNGRSNQKQPLVKKKQLKEPELPKISLQKVGSQQMLSVSQKSFQTTGFSKTNFFKVFFVKKIYEKLSMLMIEDWLRVRMFLH